MDTQPLTAKEDGITGIVDYPSDEAIPPKYQPASSADETPMQGGVGDDDDVAMQRSNESDIPELTQPGDMEDEDMPRTPFRDFSDSDYEMRQYEPTSPGHSPGTPKVDDGSDGQPQAKRSRLDRITLIQSIYNMLQLKKRKDV